MDLKTLQFESQFKLEALRKKLEKSQAQNRTLIQQRDSEVANNKGARRLNRELSEKVQNIDAQMEWFKQSITGQKQLYKKENERLKNDLKCFEIYHRRQIDSVRLMVIQALNSSQQGELPL